jgi:PmbA protein
MNQTGNSSFMLYPLHTMDITQALLADIVSAALKRGATEAEVIALESNEFSVDVRLGEIETLEESASRGLGLRVIYEGRQASASTSDIQAKALDKLVADAVEMARHTSVDEAAMLPARAEFSPPVTTELQLYDEAIAALPTERKIALAIDCEAAARAYDPRITNSEGARCSTTLGRMLLVTSSGFAGEYRGSHCGLMVAPIARDGEQMQVGGWGDRQRWLNRLDSSEELGADSLRGSGGSGIARQFF